MEDKELSQWFDINVQKPWEPGVYEAEFEDDDSGWRFFSHWNGSAFNSRWLSIERCMEHAHEGFRDRRTPIRWRGLASDQSVKPKPKARGNRMVTRYVLMDPNYSLPTPVGTYACKENAQERKQAIPGGYILKIRFSTPEA